MATVVVVGLQTANTVTSFILMKAIIDLGAMPKMHASEERTQVKWENWSA
jgi:hypothetical protein